jgi:hypothetical protein
MLVTRAAEDKVPSRTSLNGLKFGLGLSFAGLQKGKGSKSSSGITPGIPEVLFEACELAA